MLIIKKTTSIIAFILALIMCAGIFVGCASSKNDSDASESDTTGSDTSDASVTDTSSTTSDTSVDDESGDDLSVIPEDVLGEVSYIGEFYIVVEEYTVESEITDYAAVDLDAFSLSGESEYVLFEDTVEYSILSDGVFASVSADELTVGSIVAVTTSDEGVQQIIILELSENISSETIAEVKALNDDGSLELTYYELSDDAADYEITDYASVELSNYTALDETVTCEIGNTTVVYEVTDGALTESTADDITVGDMLVIYTDTSGITNIAVYHTEQETEE